MAKFRPLEERLAEKIDSSGGDDACHPWRAAKSHKNRGKRGVIWVRDPLHPLGGKIVTAVRVVLALSPNSKELDWTCGLEVLHSCHNGGNEVDCHNWRHLRWGTRQENEDDKRTRRSEDPEAPRDGSPGPEDAEAVRPAEGPAQPHDPDFDDIPF